MSASFPAEALHALGGRPEPTRARYPDDQGHAHGEGSVRVFYERYGEGGETIFLLPVWTPIPARAWKAQIPYLARHLRVIACDPRGNGRSDRPTEPAAYLTERLAADFLAVLDATATERATVVAQGPSVVPALRLAAEHAERVSGLVLSTPDPWPAERYLRSFGKGDLEAYEGWDRFNPSYWRRDWRGFVSWWVTTQTQPHPHSTRQIEDAYRWYIDAGPETFTASVIALGANRREEVLAVAARIRCPALVIYDDASQIVEGDTWTPIAEAIGAELLRIEGANQGGFPRYPVPFNLALREFAEGAAAGAPLADRRAGRAAV